MHTEQLKDVRDELEAIRNAKDVAGKDLEKARLKVSMCMYTYVYDYCVKITMHNTWLQYRTKVIVYVCYRWVS